MQKAHFNNPNTPLAQEAFQRQLAQQREDLQGKLDRAFQRVSTRNEAEMERFKKAVGNVEGFVGVISQF